MVLVGDAGVNFGGTRSVERAALRPQNRETRGLLGADQDGIPAKDGEAVVLGPDFGQGIFDFRAERFPGQALIPGQFDGPAPAFGREAHDHLGLAWKTEGVALAHLGAGRYRGAKLEAVEGRVEDVAAHVAHGPAAPFVVAAPFEGEIVGTVGRVVLAARPQLPVHFLRHRSFFHLGHALGPQCPSVVARRAAGPADHLGHFAELAGLDDFADLDKAVHGAAMVAHLGNEPGFFDGPGQFARLRDGVRKRLFHIDMFSRRHTGHGRRKVHVVRGGDDDGVEFVAHLFEHLPVVLEPWHVGVFPIVVRRLPVIHVAEGRKGLMRHLPDGMPALAAHTDVSDSQLLIGREHLARCPRLAAQRGKDEGGGSGGEGSAEETAA